MNQPMIVALDDELLFHPVVRARRDIVLIEFPHLDDDLVCKLLKARDLILKGIGFTQ
jgi:hypothetical protein